MPKKAHPMDVARTAVSLMALEDNETKDNSPKANMRKAIRIFSKTPIALAAFFRARKGKKIEERNIARKNKDYNAADNIRDELLDKGVLIEDKDDKTLWKFK